MSGSSIPPHLSSPAQSSTQILPTLSSGQLLVLESENRQPVGLILCRQFMADLILPGSALGGVIDSRGFQHLIPIGPIKLTYPETLEARQKAYHRRLESIVWQQRFVSDPIPTNRAQKLLASLYKSFGVAVIDPLQDDVLARLVGVLPGTIATVRQRIVSALQHQSDSLEPDTYLEAS